MCGKASGLSSKSTTASTTIRSPRSPSRCWRTPSSRTGRSAGSHRDGPGRRDHVPRHARRRRRRAGGAARGRRSRQPLARRRRPQAGRRRRGARRLLVRRLPALRCDREVRARDGRGHPCCCPGPAGVGDLQRFSDPVRGGAAAGRADPQRRPAFRLPRSVARGRVELDGVDVALRAGRRPAGAAEVGRGPLRRQRERARRARGRGPGGFPLPRQPERLDARHRGHLARPTAGSSA